MPNENLAAATTFGGLVAQAAAAAAAAVVEDAEDLVAEATFVPQCLQNLMTPPGLLGSNFSMHLTQRCSEALVLFGEERDV